jgi:hypothetical protein
VLDEVVLDEVVLDEVVLDELVLESPAGVSGGGTAPTVSGGGEVPASSSPGATATGVVGPPEGDSPSFAAR